MIVTTVVYDETPGSCPYEAGDEGGDPGFLTGYTIGVGAVLK